MDRAQRMYKLREALSAHRGVVSCRTLEEKLECSKSSVKRIIRELRDLGTPVVYAIVRNLTLVTRNDKDFSGFPAKVLNPWLMAAHFIFQIHTNDRLCINCST